MSSKLRRSTVEGDELKMNLSPMIDLVFLLLIFFMVSSTMILYRMDPDVKIPIAPQAKTPKDAAGRAIINIYSDGTVKDESGKPLDLDGVTEYIRKTRERNEKLDANIKTKIHLRADQRIQLEKVKEVLESAALGGVSDVVFSTYVIDKGD